MKHWTRRIILIILGTAMGLLACEGIVRLLGVGNITLTRGSLHAHDPDVGWICQPNADTHYMLPGSFNVHVTCNSRGLRDEEIVYTKPDDVLRIACLGDSFMWGYGVENDEMFSTRLENLIPRCETINLGSNGYSTIQELIRLETEGIKYDPDWVVLFFCWNDLEDNFCDKDGGRPAGRISGDGTLEIINRPVKKQWKLPLRQWLRHHSRLFNYLEYWTARFRLERRNEKKINDQAKVDKPVFSPKKTPAGRNAARASSPRPPGTLERKEDALVMEFSLLDLYGTPTEAINRAWKLEELALAKIKRMISGQGGKMLVAFVAAQETMSRNFFSRTMAALGANADRETLDWGRPAKRLEKICSALDIHYLDMTPLCRKHARTQHLYLKNNPHWSAAGHNLAAEAVAEIIMAFTKGE